MTLEIQTLITATLGLAVPLTAWAIIVWQEKRDARRQREQESARKSDSV
ncbi:MAG: hypothetical protein FD180_2996 [Planctomycetota bacterium]|nr:MAG: hypothetical protein FD180_2996 [Planctomycetota bacterium]